MGTREISASGRQVKRSKFISCSAETHRREHARRKLLSFTYAHLTAFLTVLLLTTTVSRAYPEDRYGFQIKKDPELQQIRPKKPVKIKLKRTGKNEYIWELTGDDADEIIKADKKLRKLLDE